MRDYFETKRNRRQVDIYRKSLLGPKPATRATVARASTSTSAMTTTATRPVIKRRRRQRQSPADRTDHPYSLRSPKSADQLCQQNVDTQELYMHTQHSNTVSFCISWSIYYLLTGNAIRSVQSWNRTLYSKKSWRITTELNATKFCHTHADTFCNNNSSLRTCVSLSEILIFISFVHAISEFFYFYICHDKYGET